jgi:hypothetical protein
MSKCFIIKKYVYLKDKKKYLKFISVNFEFDKKIYVRETSARLLQYFPNRLIHAF